MTTVGYGDVVPRSAIGKAISACLILLGYSLIIVPSTFIGAEFVNRDADHDDSTVCGHCEATGHLKEAEYCYRCGTDLAFESSPDHRRAHPKLL